MTRIGQDIPGDNDAIFTGDDVQITTQVRKRDGTAKDLTSSTVNFGLAPEQGRTLDLEKSSSTGNDVQITDAADGEIEIVLTSTDTDDIGAGVYYYEIEVEDANGITSTVATGDIRISRDTV